MAPLHQQDSDATIRAAAPRVTRRRALGLALTVGAGGLLLAACGGSATATIVPQATVPTAPTATVGATARPPGTAATRGTGTATAATKVNANTASQAEIAAAFQAAAIANADRWAKEVVEYRPYPANDPTFAKLRGELAKYNPGPGVVDQIIATLSLT